MLPFNPFSELTSKVFGAIAVASLVFSGVQTWRIDRLKTDNAQYELKLKTSNESIKVLQEAFSKTKESINQAKEIANSKTKAAEKALSAAKRKTVGLQSQIDSIHSESLTSDGLCHTPSIILNTEGL